MRKNKFLGQYFMRCRWVISTMIHAAELSPNDVVLEVGPGNGVLTRAVASKVYRVIAVEKDQNLAAKLRESLKKEGIKNIEVVTGDILRLLKTAPGSNTSGVPLPERYKVVANIPYYLTSRLLRLLLEGCPKPNLIVLTIQKEVAQRICAKPPQMNLLAVLVQVFGKPEIIKKVPRECFSPMPRVESAILKVADVSDDTLRKNGIEEKDFWKTARMVFSGRRKMILNNIAGAVGKPTAIKLLKKAGVEREKRAGELTVQSIAVLAKELSRLRTGSEFS